MNIKADKMKDYQGMFPNFSRIAVTSVHKSAGPRKMSHSSLYHCSMAEYGHNLTFFFKKMLPEALNISL